MSQMHDGVSSYCFLNHVVVARRSFRAPAGFRAPSVVLLQLLQGMRRILEPSMRKKAGTARSKI